MRFGAALLSKPIPPADTRVVFLDRDGVINRRRPDHVKSWAEFEFLPGVLQTLAELTRLAIRLVIVTNQSAVARGLLEPRELARLHARMTAEIRAHGGELAAIYVCTHLPDAGCKCRKPGTGLFRRAAADLRIPLEGSVMIGDSPTDEEAARSVGCRPILVGSAQPAHGTQTAPDLAAAAVLVRAFLAREQRELC